MLFAIRRSERDPVGRPDEPQPHAQELGLQVKALDAFFARLEAAPQRALLLDYDGTLAPFRVDRDRAHPYPGVLEAVGRLMRDERNRVVVVTGRKISDFQAVSGFPERLEVWGSHGWEHRDPDGACRVMPGNPAGTAGLARAAQWLGRQGLDGRIERKPGCLAVHWRGLPARQVGELRGLLMSRLPEFTAGGGLAIHEFDGGVGLRMTGRNKATAVRAVLGGLPAGSAAAFLGDDLTDEDALGVLEKPHLGILVRAQWRPTRARVWLRPPGDVLAFFERWERAGGREGASR